ncbi:YihY/virulence factor BrkB family protein [Nonomuraea jiangxiensis]|uniref:Membrane protein n=1 Tax=Nonomuraea jiangxiensis TaxID=633440 RepID=A0A1G8FSM1_9ACTN|nr:YihY/virulence factor BrkB family protein [Nonomuraea jiangxiensis]SDH85107.1 membrane protein [Nonomuraea jiangxiensis]
MAGLARRIGSVKSWGRRKVDYWRVRRLSIDHLIRAVGRYQVQHGDRLAGAVTYFAFLSFFPLVALAYAVLGFMVETSEVVRNDLKLAIVERLPVIADGLNLDAIARSKEAAGIVGLLGLLYAGLGAIDALRGALREMSMTTTPPLGFFAGKLRDLATLLMIGATLIVSVPVAGFATSATDKVVDSVGGASLGNLGLRAVGVAASVAADWLLFLILLAWVARTAQPFRVIAKGALLGAIGFGLLKQVATLVLGHTVGNLLYGAFAVIVGLLVWINVSARLVLYVAAWTATTGFCPPPSPSPIPSSGEAPGSDTDGAPGDAGDRASAGDRDRAPEDDSGAASEGERGRASGA